jgi:GTP:adenosylcobinamide-phosphate guanylyltransferase
MRLIEQQMINAIKERKTLCKANTSVTYNHQTNSSCVYLHGNHIATVGVNYVEIFDGGWQSNTTKSRLNAIINGLCDGRMFGVFQKNYEWFIKDAVINVEFENGYTLPRN